jgi:hypothetical protein
MLQLGVISQRHGNLLKAAEFWETARPLFERSSQAKQVEHTDQMLASIDSDAMERHRNNLAYLAELKAPSVSIENRDNLSEICDLHKPELNKEEKPELVPL